MIDVETRARRAGEAAREEARLRARELRAPVPARRTAGPARPRLLVAAGLATVLVVAVVVAAVVDRLPVPVIEPARPTPPTLLEPMAVDGVLPVPEVGDALPAYLEDGRPVFVSHPADGEVVVLDAADARTVWGWPMLVVYCRSSGWFEDLRHGSRYNGWGDYVLGPAPTGLRAYPSELATDGQTVRITGPRGPAPERVQPRDLPDVRQRPQRGPNCVEDDEGNVAAYQHPPSNAPLRGRLPARGGGEDAVFHRPRADAPAVDGTAFASGTWTWVSFMFGGVTGEPRVCDLDRTCPAGAPIVTGEYHGDEVMPFERVARTVLARVAAEGVIEVILPATGAGGPNPAYDARRDPLVLVPAPGQVRATVER